MDGKVGVKRKQGQAPRTVKAKAPAAKPVESMRIAKAIAHAGLCSRRDAEAWIAAGRVAVNGKVLASPAFVVSPGDKITVDNKPLPEAQAVRLWRYHKRRGLVTSHKDPQGRKTVFEALPPDLPRVVSVGRLDINTEGLLLLTTDGELARHLELPSTGWLRRYRVRAHGRVAQEALDRLREGVTLDGVHYGIESVAHDFLTRRQEPRGEADRRASRAHRQPAHPRLVRAVRARRSRRGRGR
jgi:23S rRNA pseudouridine2605 synthase